MSILGFNALGLAISGINGANDTITPLALQVIQESSEYVKGIRICYLPAMKLFLSLLLAACLTTTKAQTAIELSDIANHAGDSVKVKGKIFGVRYLEAARNTPTFINVGATYPNQVLTVVIWGM